MSTRAQFAKSSRHDTSQQMAQLWEIRKTLNVESPLRMERSQLRYFTAMWPDCHMTDWGGTSCAGYTHANTAQRSTKGRWRDYISHWLVLIGLDVEPAGLSEIVENREIFLVLIGLLPPRPCPEEKRVQNWMN